MPSSRARYHHRGAQPPRRCSHENIVVIYEVGELQGSPFMVLEYLQGRTLSTVSQEAAPMPPTRAVELIASVVRRAGLAHDQGIVHRDLKPDNILLTDAGTVKCWTSASPRCCRKSRATRRPAATCRVPSRSARRRSTWRRAPASSAPWPTCRPSSGHRRSHRPPHRHLATGLILFQMLTGDTRSRPGGDPRAWVTDLDSPLPSLRHEAPEIPAELADLVDRCLRKRKEDRIPDAAALLRALEPFIAGPLRARAAR